MKKTNARLASFLRWVVALTIVLLLLPTKNSRADGPQLIRYSEVIYEITANQMFDYIVPYSHLADLHKELIRKYKPILIKTYAQREGYNPQRVKIGRVGMPEHQPRYGSIIYYEVKHGDEDCDILELTIYKSGNYLIAKSSC